MNFAQKDQARALRKEEAQGRRSARGQRPRAWELGGNQGKPPARQEGPPVSNQLAAYWKTATIDLWAAASAYAPLAACQEGEEMEE